MKAELAGHELVPLWQIGLFFNSGPVEASQPIQAGSCSCKLRTIVRIQASKSLQNTHHSGPWRPSGSLNYFDLFIMILAKHKAPPVQTFISDFRFLKSFQIRNVPACRSNYGDFFIKHLLLSPELQSQTV